MTAPMQLAAPKIAKPEPVDEFPNNTTSEAAPTIAPRNKAGANTPQNKPKPIHKLVKIILKTIKESKNKSENCPARAISTDHSPWPKR